MVRSASLTTLGAVLLVLALISHLWMLDAPDLVGEHLEPGAVAFVATPPPLSAMAGCSSGMSACHVPMPDQDPVGVTLLTFVGLLVLGGLLPRRAGAAVVNELERSPPHRPAVPSSVVLLI